MKYYTDTNGNLYANLELISGNTYHLSKKLGTTVEATEVESAIRADGTLLPKHKNLGDVETTDSGEYYKYYNQDGTADLARIAKEQAQALEAEYTQALEAHMDSKAKEKGYDNRYTSSLRANSPVEKFKLEGQAYIAWMDNCYALGYQVMADVQAGTRPLPTVEEFLAELPELVW